VGCRPKNISLPNCDIIGKIPVEQIYSYYNSASIFCLPTLREPFGIVLVEAMNYRLPVISNNIGSIPDLIQNGYNGYLINNNINEYTNAICHLFDSPSLCMEMGENGYCYAQSKFQWEIVGQSIKKGIDESLPKSKQELTYQ
jgi:glycosyltransferase involved in cell wall biosynthesis